MPRRTIDITLPSLTGRRAVVTGGSDGIGLRIATRLARAGAEVILPVRTSTKGDAAVRSIRADTPAAEVRTLPLDLSSLESVESFGAPLRAAGAPHHRLGDNAGGMTPPARQPVAHRSLSRSPHTAAMRSSAVR